MDNLSLELDDAINRADVVTVKTLLAHGANPNSIDGLGWTPLMNAAWVASVELVSVLLEAGADPKKKNAEGNTAIDLARSVGHNRFGHASVIEFLEGWQTK